MLPIVFEWHWDLGHFVFMGLFYTALGVIGLGILYCLASTFKDLYSGAEPHSHGHDGEHGEEGH